VLALKHMQPGIVPVTQGGIVDLAAFACCFH
jgi:hypothetical protein